MRILSFQNPELAIKVIQAFIVSTNVILFFFGNPSDCNHASES